MALTEKEIFDQLKTQLGVAIDECDKIAKYPASGEAFSRLRLALKLVEGCCRQAAQWRLDRRWVDIGMQFAIAHQIARNWLHRPSVESKMLFTKLAYALRANLRDLKRLETRPTGRTGAILTASGPSRSFDLGHTGRMPAGLIMPSARA